VADVAPDRQGFGVSADLLRERLTITVPEAGEYLGLGRGASYAAAKRGEIPTLAFGGRLVVPVPKLLEMVGLTLDRTESGDAA
jgi:excisionase family DNA binding protein